MGPGTRGKLSVVAVLAVAIAAVLVLKGTPPRRPAGAPVSAAASRAAGVPRLLDLGADKCIPCKAMKPILDGLRRDYAGRLQVDFIDVWKDAAAAEKHDVQTIPTQIFFDASGKELYRHTGFYSREDILARFHELGMRL